MLVPLETLPSWPAAPDPTVLQVLGLLLAVPLILALLIGGASYLATTRALRNYGPPINPARVYATAPAIEGAPAEPAAVIEAGAGDAGTGGTSARW